MRVALISMVLLAAAPAAAQEGDAARCSNRVDDDGDGRVDCMDSECSLFVFCAQAQQTAFAPPARLVASTHPNWLLAGAGIALFTTAWALEMAITGATSTITDSILFSIVPLAGPFIQTGYTDNDGQLALVIVDGIAQIAGVVLFIVGLAVPQTDYVPVYAISDDVDVMVLPWASPRSMGALARLSWR